ncbi:hypothetical protein FDUTEX481_02818 [Tolypothrix sp. PCC 7601]|nr:hypothetical protein FDUTEX481_02818 [Tolypothrix sp. PCC 7601]
MIKAIQIWSEKHEELDNSGMRGNRDWVIGIYPPHLPNYLNN